MECLNGNYHHIDWGMKLFPKDPPIIKYEAILEAGDAVYIPPMWYHGVDTADNNVGVTFAYCFGTPVEYLQDRRNPVIDARVRLPEYFFRIRTRYLKFNMASKFFRFMKGIKTKGIGSMD